MWFGTQPILSAGTDDYAKEYEAIRCVSPDILAGIAFLNS